MTCVQQQPRLSPWLPGFATDDTLTDLESELAFLYYLLFDGRCSCRDDFLCMDCSLVVAQHRARVVLPALFLRHLAGQDNLATFLDSSRCSREDATRLKQAFQTEAESVELNLSLKTLYHCFYLGNVEYYEKQHCLPEVTPLVLQTCLCLSSVFQAFYEFDPLF